MQTTNRHVVGVDLPTKQSSQVAIVPMLSSIALGAALMYFFDPIRGRKRRARLADAMVHARRSEHMLLEKAMRDAQHRVHGVAERAVHALAPDVEVDDDVVAERIRATLGRVASHPRAIEIRVDRGRVVIGGEILAREAEAVVSAIRSVACAHQVVDQLDRRTTARSSPALQGERHVQRHPQGWTPALRIGAIAGGGICAIYGFARRGPVGALARASGVALVVRAATNRPLGRAGEIRIQKTITVHAPIERVFELWRRLDTFPKLMSHVREVQVTEDRSHWEVDGPLGVQLRFDAEITRCEANRTIAWRTLPGQAMIEHEGSVRFDGNGESTRVHLQMSYRPPFGAFGHAIARLLGWDPKHRMDDDLMRMKALLEQGHTRTLRNRIELSELIPKAAT